MKLWLWFVCFAAIIFAALWLLQTVFLENFYDSMAIRNVKRAAAEISAQQSPEAQAGVASDCAIRDSLLIFLTDWSGSLLFSADEHSSVYQERQTWSGPDGSGDNPYREAEGPLNWQMGAFRNLPAGYGDFLQRLASSESGAVGYRTESGEAYVYGLALGASGPESSGQTVLYISTQLGAVGAAVSILRIQLVWVTLASLILGFFLAYWISGQFARPISSITAQARAMANGEFRSSYKRGFCSELDALSDTLGETGEALARLENARRELLANVSHDLRTPLTMIKGYAEMVREISWNDDARRDEDLSVIIREADRLTGLVNDILEYSALQAPGVPEEREEFDLSAVTEQVVEQFAPLCQQNGWEIEALISPGQWVCGSEEQLKRVLYNLMDNALCHAGDRQKVRVCLTGGAATVRVEVRDYGEGIPQQELPYIWDRYFTARQRKQRGGRSGLGLAITKEILQLHKAEFGVESRQGQGSTFWFALARCAPPRDENGESDGASHRPSTLLPRL